MSFNLVDFVKDQISNQVTGYIGDMLGGDSKKATSVLDAGIPALLSSLSQTASTPTGAKAMFDTIKDTDDSILDNIGDLLKGDKSSSLISQGTSMLSSLLGGGNSNGGLSSIINSVSNFAGVSKDHSTSIMGLLAPMIFSTIKRKFMGGDSGFNVDSLVNLFSEQKHNIQAAMPQGFTLDSSIDNTVEHVRETTERTYEKAEEVVHQEKSLFSKLLPLLALLALGWIGYNMFMKKNRTLEPTTTVTETTHVATPVAEATAINVEELGSNVNNTMKSLVSSLSEIKDVQTAKEIVPKLTQSVDSLGQYAALLDKIPAPARATVVKYATDYLPQIQELLNKIGSIPGVGAIIKPVVDNLNSKLALFK